MSTITKSTSFSDVVIHKAFKLINSNIVMENSTIKMQSKLLINKILKMWLATASSPDFSAVNF